MVIAAVIVVVVVVAGVAAYLALSSAPGGTTTTPSSSTSQTTLSSRTTPQVSKSNSSSTTSTSTTTTTTTSTTSSTTTTTTTTSTTSSSTNTFTGTYFAFYFSLNSPPVQALLAPGNFTEVVMLSIYHSLATNDEPVSLNATAPPGLTVRFVPSSPVNLPASHGLNVTIHVQATKTIAAGNYTIQISGNSGPNSQSTSFSVRVVHNLVRMVRNTFLPPKMNVTIGDTVFWQDLDGATAGCGASSTPSPHNIVFPTLPAANSQKTMNQFDTYSYTFTQTGTFFYYSSLDSDHLMNGTINVLAAPPGGPMGMPAPVVNSWPVTANGASTAPVYAMTKSVGGGPMTMTTPSKPTLLLLMRTAV